MLYIDRYDWRNIRRNKRGRKKAEKIISDAEEQAKQIVVDADKSAVKIKVEATNFVKNERQNVMYGMCFQGKELGVCVCVFAGAVKELGR